MSDSKEKKVYLKLRDKFIEQFPSHIEPYLMVDTQKKGKYQLTYEVRDLEYFGYKVVMDVPTARRIQEELNELPLVMVDYKGEGI